MLLIIRHISYVHIIYDTYKKFSFFVQSYYYRKKNNLNKTEVLQ